jgi:acylphosphatase
MLRFFGQVQGVGFRWNARNIARDHGLSGWVANLPDGSVEVVAEGESRELQDFVEALRVRMDGCIRDESRQTAPANGLYADFEIRH